MCKQVIIKQKVICFNQQEVKKSQDEEEWLTDEGWTEKRRLVIHPNKLLAYLVPNKWSLHVWIGHSV